MRTYVTTIAVSYSIIINAIVGGMRYEMLSSRAYRCGWWFTASLIDWWFELIFDEDDHCKNCFELQRREGIYDL